MKYLSKYILLFLTAYCFCSLANAEESADAVLSRVAKAVKTADGVSASFSLSSGGQNLSGTLKSSGSKFSLVTSSTSVWYDGKTMWTYNSKTNETTVTLPTSAELAEVNPLYIVNAYSNNFTAAYAKNQTKGNKTIVMTPKSKKLGYKSVHVTIPDRSSFPSQLVVIPSSGQKITVRIDKVSTGVKLSSSAFEYPKSKYPKAEIVDLR